MTSFTKFPPKSAKENISQCRFPSWHRDKQSLELILKYWGERVRRRETNLSIPSRSAVKLHCLSQRKSSHVWVTALFLISLLKAAAAQLSGVFSVCVCVYLILNRDRFIARSSLVFHSALIWAAPPARTDNFLFSFHNSPSRLSSRRAFLQVADPLNGIAADDLVVMVDFGLSLGSV